MFELSMGLITHFVFQAYKEIAIPIEIVNSLMVSLYYVEVPSPSFSLFPFLSNSLMFDRWLYMKLFDIGIKSNFSQGVSLLSVNNRDLHLLLLLNNTFFGQRFPRKLG